tara:strand:+ start:3215 stop:4579 length:1365 start_codon:yes stop_codon:yes gene_type:complete
MPASILIVDDEPHTLEGLEAALEDRYEITTANNAKEAFNHLESDRFDVVLTDLRMAGKSGMSVIERTLTISPRPVCIMMTAYGNVETAVDAMKRGAYDFLTKPVSLEKLELLIERALKTEQLEKENQTLHQRLDQKFKFDEILGNSPKLQKILDTVRLVAPSKATVLIEGETGTGKELIAQAIHQNSDRSRRPFVAVHCAALASNLLESELFGHEKGAFTGATERRIGRFEAADGGTLFLDEIGEIDASTQIKLLRFLETRTLERLGSVKTISIDARLVCATNKDLAAMARRGNFRADLLYRLNVISLDLPPLRDRQEDIPLLLEYYVDTFSRENNLPPVTFSPDAVGVLQKYRWPGNIRELRNFCENIVILKRGSLVTEYDLETKFFDEGPPARTAISGLVSNPLSVEENEKRLLRNALQKTGGNKTQAAELLGMSRRTLHRKLARWPELLES